LLKSQLYVNQQVNHTKDFFKVAEAMHLQNVAENTSLHKMKQSRLNFPSVADINRMIMVAEIVEKDHPWASQHSCPTIKRSTASQELDQPSKDILTLADDIRAYSLLPTAAELQFTVKTEEDSSVVHAIIRTYFADYRTFDVEDLRSLRTIQEMSTETFEQETAKLIAYLSAAYPAVPRLANCKDIFSMLILIHETYNGISSQYNIQGTIQNTIRNFGVTNNDSPMDFATELHTYLHNAQKLNQNINISNLRVMLRQHVQTQGAQIDSVIRERIMTFTEPTHEMIELIRALQDLTIQHACPTGTSRSFMASTPATVTPSSTQLSPSQLYSQQKDAQQGLRSATPQPKTSNSDGAGRNGDTTLFTHPHGICQTFLKHRSCPYGHDCKFIHVANPGCLLGPEGHSLHRPTDFTPL
jgi:hypothetical protein